MGTLIKNIFFVFAIIYGLPLASHSQELCHGNLDYSLILQKTCYMLNNAGDSAQRIDFPTSDKRWLTFDSFIKLSNHFVYDDKSFFVEQYGKSSTWLGRKLTMESFIKVKAEDFKLAVDPLFNFNVRHSIGDSSKNYFQNTRGLMLRGTIADKLYFETSYYENQASFVNYVNNFVKKYAVVPGQSLVKNFKASSFDYGTAYGLISYTPYNKSGNLLNIQLGNDKNFLGDGYRSLLLSDFSSPYPYLKLVSKYKKLSYTCLFASFQNIFDGNIIHYDTLIWNAAYQKKTATFHYLSYFVDNRFDISLFESTIWQVADSGGKRFNPDFFNPVILCHTAEFGLNGKNNCMLGLNLMYKLTDKMHLYGQLACDDIRIKKISEKGYFHNRYGLQAGIEGFDLFGIENLNVQTEYNQAQPYMYSAKSPSESYTHYNQPLADPLGANFKEGIGIIRYRIRKYFIRAQINVAVYGADSASSNWGNNVFLSDKTASQNGDNRIGQGIRTTLKYADVCLSYLLNPATNMNIFVGATYRVEKNKLNNSSVKFIYMGFRTSLLNEYFDF